MSEDKEKEVPKRGTGKTIAKKEFSLADFKNKNKIEDTDIKPLTWLRLSDAYRSVTGLEGIPIGELTLIRGYSDTSKSTIMYESAIAAQQAGMLPVIIDTENALKKDYLTSMGFDFNGDYIYVDSDYLLKNYGKKYNKEFTTSSIEDVSEFINEILDKQESEELPMDVVFCWDSIGSLDGRKVLTAKEKGKEDNNLWNAASMEHAFKGIFHHRIPSSRKSNKKYTATFIAVQKIWFDSMVGGQGVIRHKGGEAAYSFSRLIIHMGGTKTRSVEKVNIVKNKKTTTLGSLIPIKVAKNHCSSIAFEGKIFSCGEGLKLESEINGYKDRKLDLLLKELGETSSDGIEIKMEIDNSKDE